MLIHTTLNLRAEMANQPLIDVINIFALEVA